MAVDPRGFFKLKPAEQIKYMEGGEFGELSREEKIDFLKAILKEDPPPEITICALRLLKELDYPDRYYFRKFIYHRDKSAADMARQIIDEWPGRKSNGRITVLDMLREGKSDDLILLANYFLQEKEDLSEQTLISFLCTGDRGVREVIVNKVTRDYQLDDAKLSKAIHKGTAWYVRAALVEILGNRRSEHLFDCIDLLMRDSNVEVKLKLIAALLKFELEKGKAYLQKLTGDPTIWVRKEALRALKSMGGTDKKAARS
jgi:hypothetical protein